MNFAYESSDWRAMLGLVAVMLGVLLINIVMGIAIGVWIKKNNDPLFYGYLVAMTLLSFGFTMIVWAAVRTEEP